VQSGWIANPLGVAELGPYPATLLLLLMFTVVTPANIYMFTHNPNVPNILPVMYPTGHGVERDSCSVLY
jgi:hypothetical protein